MDDIIMLEKSQDGLNTLSLKLNNAASRVGLHINELKTASMIVICQYIKSLKLGIYELNKTDQLKYLGLIIVEQNKITK